MVKWRNRMGVGGPTAVSITLFVCSARLNFQNSFMVVIAFDFHNNLCEM